LRDLSLIEKIRNSNPVSHGGDIDDGNWDLLISVISGSTVLRNLIERYPAKARLNQIIISYLRDYLYTFDLKQEHIGKSIPPGPQRIRGIAGSGKTVLLCQKAAHYAPKAS